jgi:hypothetical protein
MATVTVEELELISKEERFLDGLRLWATKRDPLPFNIWQQGFAQIRNVFQQRGDPDVPRAGPDYTSIVSALRDEIMEDIHGPLWKQSLKGPLRPTPKAVLRGRGATVRPLAAGLSPAAEADGGGSVSPALPEADGRRRAAGQEEAGGGSSVLAPRAPASASGRLQGGVREGLFEFVIPAERKGRPATVAESLRGVRRGLPPVKSAEEQAAGMAAPGAAPVEDPSPLPLLSSKGQAYTEYFAADGSEASEEILERTARLKASMEDAGFAGAEIELSLRIEYYMRDLAVRWQEDAELTGSTEGIAPWGMRQLLSQDFGEVAEFATLEAQVRALSRLAGLTYEEATAQLNRIWYSTPAGSAARRSQGSGRVRSSHFSTPKRTTPGRSGEDGGADADAARPAGTPATRVKREAGESGPSRAAHPAAGAAGGPAAGAAGDRVFVAHGGGEPASPSRDVRDAEIVKTLQEIQKAFQATPRGPTRLGLLTEEDLKEQHESIHSIAGLEFKQNLPVIKDTDTDLDRHIREYQSILDCHTIGKKGVRPYDMLTVFRKTLAPGGTRLKVYDTVVKRARKLGRLPLQAKEVYEEILVKLRRTIRETKMQRKERVEKEFEDLVMGKLSHSAFRAEWEYYLEEFGDAELDLPSKDTLYRRYLRKITPELRSAVLKQVWQLEPDGNPRKPETWEEVAECVEMELESRADARAPQDSLHAMGEASAASVLTCSYCSRHDHHTELCPKRAADLRGESSKCVVDYERGGRVCAICRQSDHNEEHHRLAAMDYVAQSGAARGAENGSAGRGRGQGGRGSGGRGRGSGAAAGAAPPAPAPPPQERRSDTPCRFGASCWKLLKGQSCGYKHTPRKRPRLPRPVAPRLEGQRELQARRLQRIPVRPEVSPGRAPGKVRASSAVSSARSMRADASVPGRAPVRALVGPLRRQVERSPQWAD